MTENKRFTIFGEWHKDCIIDEIRDNTGEYVTIGRVVNLLNENEQLKMKLKKQKDEELEWALSQIEDNKALAIIEKRLGRKNTMLRAKSVPCQH